MHNASKYYGHNALNLNMDHNALMPCVQSTGFTAVMIQSDIEEVCEHFNCCLQYITSLFDCSRLAFSVIMHEIHVHAA